MMTTLLRRHPEHYLQKSHFTPHCSTFVVLYHLIKSPNLLLDFEKLESGLREAVFGEDQHIKSKFSPKSEA